MNRVFGFLMTILVAPLCLIPAPARAQAPPRVGPVSQRDRVSRGGERLSHVRGALGDRLAFSDQHRFETGNTESGFAATWGGDPYGQIGTTVPPAWEPRPVILTGAKQVSAGDSHSLAVKEDGTVWASGGNGFGQLGDGTLNDRSVPVRLSGLSGVVAVSAGGFHSLAVKNDGTVWAWGRNQYGQIGDGTTLSKGAPVRVDNLTGVVAVSAGWSHSLALKEDGTVWAWGFNGTGALGDGTMINRSLPVRAGDLTGVVAVRAGLYHSLALKDDGSVWAWGSNRFGQIGNEPSGGGTSLPVPVSNLTGVVAVTAGAYHGLALKEDGTVWAWGDNLHGQIGDGTTYDRRLPVRVSDVTDVVAVSAGGYNSVALKDDGTVWAWGNNQSGQIGDSSIGPRQSLPVRVGGLTDAVAVSTGGGHNLALKRDGAVWGWGNNYNGQIGDGGTIYIGPLVRLSISAPVRVSDLTHVASGSAGEHHSLALKDDGTVWAWGRNYYGQLGYGDTGRGSSPVPVSDLSGVKQVSAGYDHSLAVKDDGTVWAWGRNLYGQLGDGTTVSKSLPTLVSRLTDVVAVSGGGYHSLAVEDNGTVWAWGSNESGQLGDGTTISKSLPVRVSGLTDVVAVSAGVYHSLALKDDGSVWAWGSNGSGQLGDGGTTDKSAPVRVSGLTGVLAVSAGGFHNLALKDDGTVWAWGSNGSGQLGDGTTDDRSLPVRVSGLTEVRSVSGGGYHSLAVKEDGTVWAWGNNGSGRLGDGTTLNRSLPVRVSGLSGASGVSAVSAGVYHSLAVATRVAATLAFVTQPAAGGDLTLTTQPVIEVRGTDGSLVDNFTGSITVFVKPGTGASGSYLTGTTTVDIVDGVANFADLGLSQRGHGYVLRAISPNLHGADSQPFDVVGGPFAWWDVQRALRFSAGLSTATSAEIASLSVAPPFDNVDLLDAVSIARKVAGLEANPQVIR